MLVSVILGEYYDGSHLPVVNMRARSHGIHCMSCVAEHLGEIPFHWLISFPQDHHFGRSPIFRRRFWLEPRYDRIQQKKFYSALLATVAHCLANQRWLRTALCCLRTWKDQKGDYLFYTHTHAHTETHTQTLCKYVYISFAFPWHILRAAAPAADPGKKKRGSQCNPQSSQVRWMDVCPRLLDLCFCCSPSLLSVRIETLHLRPVRCSFICQYSATPKHHGSEGRTRHEIAPKKCLTSLLKSY